MPIPPLSDDEILAHLNANDRAVGRMALLLLSAVLGLVAIYAAAFFTGEIPLLQSEEGQIAIGVLFVATILLVAAGFARRFRPVADSDANDPRIVRRRIDAHHRYWRLILVPFLLMALENAYFSSMWLSKLGHIPRLLAVAAGAAMIATLVLPALWTIAGPAWINQELRAIIDDEFVRELRARTIRLGYIVMLIAVSAGILVALWRPDLALPALAWSLCAGSTIPALYYVIADWRAGREK